MKKLNSLLISGLISLSLLSSQASATIQSDVEPLKPAKTMNSEDPYEKFNRSVYAFNMGFHNLVGAPITNVYLNYVPSPAQTGFKNFFSNLTVPLDAFNSLLQGKVEQSLESFMRFTINTTFGIGGLLDIATPAGLPKKDEDFGQTLSVWGAWNEASFVMVPFIGPQTTRSIIGSVGDSMADPVYVASDIDKEKSGIVLGSAFVNYADVAPYIETLKTQPDPYIFMRESYLQFRTNLIYDGQPPVVNLDDFNFE